MNEFSSLETEVLKNLVAAFRQLPGIGLRSARRITYHLLQNDIQGAKNLIHSLEKALLKLKKCPKCNSFTEVEICGICSDLERNQEIICIVEMPIDIEIIENSHSYNGLYYVLMGRINLIEGVGVNELNFRGIVNRIKDEKIQEVILATNFTTEGDTTAYLLSEILLSTGIKITRLARGIPSGSELEYVDSSTISWSLMRRKKIRNF